MSSDTISRRNFLGLAGTSVLASMLPAPAWGQTPSDANNSVPTKTAPASATNSKGEYILPLLPYAYDALEPVIDEQTMRLHHDHHLLSYVDGLNQTQTALNKARQANDFQMLSFWEDQLAFHGAGFVLHTLFFQNMAPVGSTRMSEYTRSTLARDFGSAQAFKAQFSAAANQVQGSGWAILAYQPMGKRLFIFQAQKHQNLTQWNVVPILALDVWEHAYYLKYHNKRADYVKAWWDVVNWNDVQARLKAIPSLG